MTLRRGNIDGCVVRRRATRPRRTALFCMKLAATVMLVAVVAAGVLAVRINAGPIRIDGFGQTIARALHDRFGNGLRFALGGTSIVQRGLGTSLSVDRLSVTWPDGEPILTAPRAELAVSTSALLFGSLVPKRLEVFDVTLRAVFLKNGDLAIAAADGSRPFVEVGRSVEGPGEASKPLAEVDASQPRERAVVMRQAAALLRQILDVLTDPRSPIAAVDRLGIAHGTLVIQDQETSAETVYRGLDLSFDKQNGSMRFAVSAEGPTRRWSITATATGTPGGERRFALQVEDLTIDEIRLAAGSRSRDVDTDAPVAFHVDLGLKPDNTLSEASGGFAIGAGYLRTDDPDFEPLFVTTIGSDFRWDGATRRILLQRLRYVEGDTHFLAEGDLMTPAREGEPWKVALHLTEPGLFAPDRKGQAPLPVEAGQFDGQLLLDRKTFLIDRVSFRPREGGMALAGQFDWVHGPHLRLGASMDPTAVATIGRLWPSFLAAEVRAWALNHFEAGLVSDATMQLDYDEADLKRLRADRPPADKSVSIDFKMEHGRVRYLDGVPPLDDLVGTAHITGRTTHLAVAGATTNVDGRRIALTGGTFVVPDNGRHPVQAVAAAHLSGSVEAVMQLLSRDALKPYASLPLDPTTLHGQIEGDLRKTLALGEGPADPALETLSINAAVANFAAERLLGKEGLEGATMVLSVENGAMKASGQGRAFGGPASFEISRKEDGAAPHAELGLTLDEAARAKLGMPSLAGVSGPIAAHVVTDIGGDPAKMKADVELDLTRTALAVGLLGVNKPAGRPAKVALTLAAAADRMVMDPVAIDLGGGVQGRGSVELAGDNSFQAAHFAQLKLSPGDDMRLDAAKADGVIKLTVRGTSIDARPFLKAVTSTAEPALPPRGPRGERKDADGLKGFDIDLKSSLLTGFNKEVLSGAELRLSKRDDAIRQFSLQGHFGRNAVSGVMGPNGTVRISSGDAGALVSFIDLYKHMEGGTLTAAMQLAEDALSGNLEIRDFVLRDEPAIRRLVATSATLSAPGQDADAARRINGGAVEFKRLKVGFERDGSHLQLKDATMYGPQIGLSVDGWLDYSHDRVGMKGTFVPAFAVNNLFSQIPVFGVFLGGKSNEGLLAITFNISGSASQPTLNINPLSAITPGFLRNIFGPVFEAPTPEFSTTR